MRYLLGLIVLITFSAASQTIFEDITKDLLIADATMGFGYGSGVSAEDFDQDGDLDIVFCTDASSPSRILVNNNNGTFGEVYFFLGFNSRVALWIDYNGDHRLDVLFTGDCLGLDSTCDQTLALYEQQLDGSFIDVTSAAGLDGEPLLGDAIMSGAAAGDLNDDGFLDVIIVTFDQESIYLESQGDGFYKKVKDLFKRGRTQDWTPIFYDMNRDGWMDYYQAVDFYVQNEFWTHNGDLNFQEVARDIGLDHATEDMGIALGDYDNDSDLDVYISCIQPDDSIRGNVLYQNDGGIYTDQSIAKKVYQAGWSWGVTFIDANNDGYLDLAATNGFRDTEYDSSRFWMNNGDGTFIERSNEVQFNDTLQATSLISLDFDRDGDLDMIQTLKAEYHDEPFRLLRNELPKGSSENYLVVQPRMEGSNHWAIGSLVKIKTSTGEQIRPITAGVGYFSQEPAEAFFGLGSLTQVDEVEITWPGGGKSTVQNVSANQIIKITDADALHPPRNLVLEVIDSLTYQLSWEATSTVADGYQIERSVIPSFDFYTSFTVDKTSTTYLDSGINKDTTYYYRVRAMKGSELSRSTIHAKATFQEEIISPTELTIEGVAATSAIIGWSDMSDNEDGFIIQRSTNQSFSSFLEFQVPANTESYTDENLEPGGVYYYRLRAFSKYGQSDFSETIMLDLSHEILSAEVTEHSLIYPNPSDGTIHLKNVKDIDRVVLLTMDGQVLETHLVKSQDVRFDTNLKDGFYLLCLERVNGVKQVVKILISAGIK